MTILIDFDDTLHATKDHRPGHRMGQPEPGARSALTRFFAQGHTVIIFTGRRVDIPAVYKTVKDWLDYFQFPYHEITNIKPPSYDVIIDNKALHYDGNWAKTVLEMRKLQSRSTEEEWANESFKDIDTPDLLG